MVRNVGGAVSFHFGGAHVPRRKYRRTPAEHCRGRCPHRPAVRPECFFRLRRGRRLRRPAIGETAPTFQSISGSGAEGETILNLGYGLPNPPLADRKRKSRNLGFLRAFGHFSRAGQVTRRVFCPLGGPPPPRPNPPPPEAEQADSITKPPKKRADVGICPYSAEAGAFFK